MGGDDHHTDEFTKQSLCVSIFPSMPITDSSTICRTVRLTFLTRHTRSFLPARNSPLLMTLARPSRSLAPMTRT